MNLLGHTLRDRVTGITGIAVVHETCLAGYEQYAIRPPSENGTKLPDSVWIDTCQLEDLGEAIKPGSPERNEFALGEILREKTSGAVGTVVAINTHLNGCVRLEIAVPLREQDKDPKIWVWDHKSFERLPQSPEKLSPVKIGSHGGPHGWCAKS